MEYSRNHWYQKWWGIGLLMIIGIILAFFLLLSFLVYHNIREMRTKPLVWPSRPLTEIEKKQIEGSASPGWGTNQPLVTIVEFGDYNCLFCQKNFPAIRRLSLEYADRIKFIFRDYPVVSEASLPMALAALCAGEQGLFWPMHDKLFLDPTNQSRQQLIGLAGQIGADNSRFTTCLEQEKYLPQIKQSIIDAEALGIQGTPTWFINGNKLIGSVSYEKLVQIIESILNNQE